MTIATHVQHQTAEHRTLFSIREGLIQFWNYRWTYIRTGSSVDPSTWIYAETDPGHRLPDEEEPVK